MAWLRPIPVRLLPNSCLVREPAADGGFGEPRAISRVRFERAQSVVADAHRSADAGAGTLFVDAVTSAGAFEIPVGSRVEVDGRSYVAAKVSRFEGFNGRVHHWEVELR